MFELDESNAPLFAGHIFNCGLSQPRSSTLHVFEPISRIQRKKWEQQMKALAWHGKGALAQPGTRLCSEH